MDQDLNKKFEEQAQKLDAIYRSVERMRKYFLWTLIITVVMVVLPFIGLFFAIPQFLNTYSNLGL